MDVRDVRSLPDGATLEADVCIVGSGPAGLTLARELSGTGTDVLVLESGGLERDADADRLNEIESVGAPRGEDQSVARNRVLGGSSATWWGRLATFDEVDLAARDWVPGSGWPVTRADLRPYFARSLEHLGGGVADNNEDPALDRVAGTFPGLDTGTFRPYAWTYGRDTADPADAPRFGPRALADALPGVRCLTWATVASIGTTSDGAAVDRLEVRSPDGTRRWVRAAQVVLATGGLENARLLLASGVAGPHEQVGRHLMDHPRGPVGYYRPEDFLRVQRLLGEHRLATPSGTVRLVPGLAPTPAFQAEHRLLNTAFWLDGVVSPFDPLTAAGALARREAPLRALGAVLRGAPLLAEGLRRVRGGGRAALRRMSTVALWSMVEQPPDPASRITLSQRTDALGVPLAVVDWRIGEQEAHTVRTASRRFADEMRRLGLPVPELLPVVADDRVPFALPDAFHPAGTTRMAADPREGVVDEHCAVHGVRGLHVAGSSVFPTSGHANPTQMIVVLAVRLADRLKDLLGKGAAAPAASAAEPSFT